MYTPSKEARFNVYPVENDIVPFVVGTGRRIKVPKTCWDGIPNFLRGKSWIRIGATHGKAPPDLFEEHLDSYKHPSHPSWASYVVPVLEHLGVVEVDRRVRPSKIKLK